MIRRLRILPYELVLLLVAFWHSVHWVICRTADNSDEPWGLISLATVLILVVSAWRPERSFFDAGKLRSICIALISAYCVSFAMAPPLVRCLIAVCAFGVILWNRCLPERRNSLALFGFLLLSSPLVASLQFFIGFPLRLLVTSISAAIMNFSGTAVVVAGTSFEHNNRLILVDSPCSGINMLWAGLYFCFVLCWTKHLSLLRSLLLLIFSVSGVVLTNVSRATIMVYVEILRDQGLAIPEIAHDVVSVASFLFLALAIVLLGNVLAMSRFRFTELFLAGKDRGAEPLTDEVGMPNDKCPRETTSGGFGNLGEVGTSGERLSFGSFAVASMVAFSIPFFQTPYHEDTSKIVQTEFPSQFEGRKLKPLKLSETEARFSAGFPGRIAKFTDGNRTILFRQVNKPTRQLHPSSDCYKGNRFQLHPMAALRDENGKVWSRFLAMRNGQKLEVREIVSDLEGHSWPDTSSWYWSALLGKTQSPWVAVTVASSAN